MRYGSLVLRQQWSDWELELYRYRWLFVATLTSVSDRHTVKVSTGYDYVGWRAAMKALIRGPSHASVSLMQSKPQVLRALVESVPGPQVGQESLDYWGEAAIYTAVVVVLTIVTTVWALN